MPRNEIAAFRGGAQIPQQFERPQQHGKRRPAGGDSLQVFLAELCRRPLDEALDQPVVVLRGRLSEQLADLQDRPACCSETNPSRACSARSASNSSNRLVRVMQSRNRA